MRILVTVIGTLAAISVLVAPATPAPVFEDDFQTGIDPSRWVLHVAGGGTWVPAAENCNGYITSPPQSYLDPNDRYDQIFSTRDDFADFMMTWDMRYHTEGWHQNARGVLLRWDDSPMLPHGYSVFVGVGTPTGDPYYSDSFGVRVVRSDGSSEDLAWVAQPWALGTWYRFKARFIGNNLDLKVWPRDQAEPAAWAIQVQDPSTESSQGRLGFADYWLGITDVDNVVVSPTGPPACELPLRNPQVPLNGSELQNYLNGVGESVNVYSDQLAAQVCSTSVSGNSTFTLMIELAGYADQNAIGVYDAFQPTPTLYEVFPGNAGAGWVGLVSFLDSGDLVVNLFDDTGTLQGHTVYPGVNTTKVGFYLQGPAGTFYSEDGRNGGDPQALMYCGTGRNWGELWLCWEDLPYAGCSDRDFNDAVLLLQSLQPVPTIPTTWGGVKARYR